MTNTQQKPIRGFIEKAKAHRERNRNRYKAIGIGAAVSAAGVLVVRARTPTVVEVLARTPTVVEVPRCRLVREHTRCEGRVRVPAYPRRTRTHVPIDQLLAA